MEKVAEAVIQKELDRLSELSEKREYKSRIMSLEVRADNGGKPDDWVVTGKLTLKATENQEDESAWKIVPIEVMIMGKTAEDTVGEVLQHLNAIPVEWGDTIFEEGFFDLMQGKLPPSASVEEIPTSEKELLS